MKKHIILFSFIFTFFSCKAQLTTVNITTYNTNNKSGKYFKDIDGNYDPFLGTWENTTGNITFRVVLFKIASSAREHPFDYSIDRIEGKFYIIENLGAVNENVICQSEKTYPNGHTWNYVINASSADGINMGGFIYDNCVAEGQPILSSTLEMIILNQNGQPLTAHWLVYRKGMGIQGYTYNIPTDIILTKVE